MKKNLQKKINLKMTHNNYNMNVQKDAAENF